MYRYCIPTMVTSPTFSPESVLRDLQAAGADRVLLAIPPLNTDAAVMEDVYKKLDGAIRFFKAHGMECGVWFWAFCVDGKCDFTPMSGFIGDSLHEKCPLDPAFLDFAKENIKRVALMQPDLILFDDDLRTGNLDSGFGCLCRYHRRKMAERLDGEDVVGDSPDRAALLQKLFGGKPNKYRTAFLRSVGDSVKDFCTQMRAAVDTVNPAIRLGACSCMSVWDLDGVDSYTLARLLAGSNKPFMRLIGAPYWGAQRAFGGVRIAEVVELERMERSWQNDVCAETDVEVWAEGDAYPRPRYITPAAFMEIFDTALRASGGFAGNQKYMIDYTSSATYERGYLSRHNANRALYKAIDRFFDGKTAEGIRVYEALHKIDRADYTGRPMSVAYIQDQFFSRAARFLSGAAVPTTYAGTDSAGIVFGENARSLDLAALAKPLVLDLDAARILTERGVDVGLVRCGEPFVAQYEHFFDGNEYVALYGATGSAVLTLAGDACVLSEFCAGTQTCPASYSYRNADGASFLVYNFRADAAHESLWRNYCRPKQLAVWLADVGSPLPAFVPDCPDLYVLCKEDARGLAVGLWNCTADAVDDAVMQLAKTYASAEFAGLNGTLCGNTLRIGQIPAYGFGFVLLGRES